MTVRFTPGSAAVLSLLGLCVAASVALAHTPPLVGVNISGAELNAGNAVTRVGYDYVYPSNAELDYVVSKHMSVIRMPIAWERIQPVLGGPLNPAEIGNMQAVVAAAAQRHLYVILDLHNYGQYGGQPIGSAAVTSDAFAQTWNLLATALPAPNIVYGLMNEPQRATGAAWRDAAQQAVWAIRATGARNLVLVAGPGWDGAHDFTTGLQSSASMMGDLNDPQGNFAFEVHQYFDSDYSGTHTDCYDGPTMVAAVSGVTAWAKTVHRRLFLGEFGVAPTPACLASMGSLLGFLGQNMDVWRGWTYWVGGPWWGNYPFSIEPQNGQDKPQMGVLTSALPR